MKRRLDNVHFLTLRNNKMVLKAESVTSSFVDQLILLSYDFNVIIISVEDAVLISLLVPIHLITFVNLGSLP